ncbi:TPA: zinc ribbon domain-containing protein [Acinetobacter baumannii]
MNANQILKGAKHDRFRLISCPNCRHWFWYHGHRYCPVSHR